MKILLIKPPSEHSTRIFDDISMPEIPLELAYLGAVLEKRGDNVTILDMNLVKPSLNSLKHALYDKTYDLVGITSTTPVVEKAFKIISLIKKKSKKTRTLLGGWHASGCPIETMGQCKDLDFLIKGEGENSIKELVDSLESGESLENIRGLVYRNELGKIIENPDRVLIEDLDEIPLPAFHLLDIDSYANRVTLNPGCGYDKKKRGFYMITSRGCMFRCAFCSDHTIYKQKYRYRTISNILEELKILYYKYKMEFIWFIDPSFMAIPKRVQDFCFAIKKEKIQIKWACEGRVDDVSKELLKVMKEAGCQKILYGVESGSPRILKLMKKRIKIKHIIHAIENTKNLGIFTMVNLMYGFPGEKLEDIRHTETLIRIIKPDFLAHSIAVPYPGSDLYLHAKDKGMILNENWRDFNIFNPTIMRIENERNIHRLQKKIQIMYYLSASYLKKIIRDLYSFNNIRFYMKTIKILFRFILK